MERNNTLVRVDRIPQCDMCQMLGENTPARYDAKTRSGPWAYMCLIHYHANGIGLGMGKGQELALRETSNATG